MEELFYRYNPWWEENFTLAEIINRPDEIQILELIEVKYRIVK